MASIRASILFMSCAIIHAVRPRLLNRKLQSTTDGGSSRTDTAKAELVVSPSEKDFGGGEERDNMNVEFLFDGDRRQLFVELENLQALEMMMRKELGRIPDVPDIMTRPKTKLWTETCPGREADYTSAVRFISHIQNPQSCARIKRAVAVRGGVFGVSSRGEGIGAQLGPASWLLSLSISSGRILFKHSREKKWDTAAVLKPFTTCPAPDDTEVQNAKEYQGDDFGEDLIGKFKQFWYPPNNVFLKNRVSDSGYLSEAPYFRAAASMYLLRLTDSARLKIEDVLRKTLPSDFDPELAISMPIRGTDKCGGEATCLSFASHMEIAKEIRNQHPEIRYIILTSDDKSVISNATLEASRADGSWRFLINRFDSQARLQDTVVGSQEAKKSETEMPMALLQPLSSLHLQLRAKYFVLDGNSHWHGLIGKLVQHGGCSFCSDISIRWLDKETNPKYLSCGVENYNNPLCVERKQQTSARQQAKNGLEKER